MENSYVEQFRHLDLCFFSTGTVDVVFIPETLQIFRVGRRAAQMLKNLRFAPVVEQCAAYQEGEVGLLEPLIRQIVDMVRGSRPGTADAVSAIIPGQQLPKLALVVNNYCNLKCSYCYEHETIFRTPAHSMTVELADLVLSKFYSTFGSLGKLMFIGGEPTLNTAVITAACERAVALSREYRVEPPAFSMISNGFKFDDSTFELLKRYQIQTTFSVDGPKKVNDLVRISKSGEGSYDRVVKNLKRYKNEVDAPIGVECTITGAHSSTGTTVLDLLKFCGEELGVSSPHIVAAGASPQSALYPYNDGGAALVQQFQDAAALSIENAIARMSGPDEPENPSLDQVLSMLSVLIKRKGSNGMCPAGTTQLTVDSHGDVYPCWMFAGVKDFHMGNIRTEPVFNEVANTILEKIQSNTKRNNPQCSVCFARYLCSSCIGNNRNTTGGFERMDEAFCDTVRATAETVIVKIAEIRQDPVRWNKLRAYADVARSQQTQTCE